MVDSETWGVYDVQLVYCPSENMYVVHLINKIFDTARYDKVYRVYVSPIGLMVDCGDRVVPEPDITLETASVKEMLENTYKLCSRIGNSG